jgi:hypothetical protein
MRQHLPLAFSAAALVVAVLGATGLGEAALRAVPIATFAKNAGKVNGIKASRTPKAGQLLALNRNKKFPKTVVPAGPQGPPGAKGDQGPKGDQGAPGTAPVGGVAEVKVVSDTDAHLTTSATFVDVPGASTSIEVPAGQTARLIVRYTAETFCSGSWCPVRVTVNDTEADPASGYDFAFYSSGGATWVGAAIDRSTGSLAAGTYTVKVQYAALGAGTLRVDDSSLTVERVRLT